jgi:hypothetical protein
VESKIKFTKTPRKRTQKTFEKHWNTKNYFIFYWIVTMIRLDPPKRVSEGYSRCDSIEGVSVSPSELRHDTSSTQTLSNQSEVTPLDDVENILPPNLVLYTIPSDKQHTKQFINELQTLLMHYRGVMIQFADASDPGTFREQFLASMSNPYSTVV